MMRSRAQTIAIILSKYKKKHGGVRTRRMTFGAQTAPTLTPSLSATGKALLTQSNFPVLTGANHTAQLQAWLSSSQGDLTANARGALNTNDAAKHAPIPLSTAVYERLARWAFSSENADDLRRHFDQSVMQAKLGAQGFGHGGDMGHVRVGTLRNGKPVTPYGLDPLWSAVYATAQASLTAQGVPDDGMVTVYRGVRVPRGQDDSDKGVLSKLAHTSLTSWSTDAASASQFSSGPYAEGDGTAIILTARVPRTSIMMTSPMLQAAASLKGWEGVGAAEHAKTQEVVVWANQPIEATIHERTSVTGASSSVADDTAARVADIARRLRK
jgi:hypothetical protein